MMKHIKISNIGKMMLGGVLTLSATFGALATVNSQPVAASWGVSDQHQLVPLYVYPDWWNEGNDWAFACNNSNSSGIGSTIIANPSNGPSEVRNTDYAQAIEICHDAGQNVIGYVDTSYGAVPLTTVKADIDKWYSQYNGDTAGVYDLGQVGIDTNIDGIFLDQVGNFPDQIVTGGDNITAGDYYRQIFTYIKQVADPNYDDVVANPGAVASTDWQLKDTGPKPTQIADEVVVFEGTPADLAGFNAPKWVKKYPASDIGMLVYNVAQTDIPQVCANLKAKGAGLVDVVSATITPVSTPWNSLDSPAYWNTFRNSCS